MKRLFSVCLILSVMLCSASVSAEERPCYFNDEENHIYACSENAGRRIALTFDDGPHPEYTDRILEVLAEYRAKATFFVVGENVAQYPEVFQRVIDAGHAIGCHTYSHRHVKNLCENELRAEYLKCEELLSRFGVKTKLFRPPEGVCDEKVLKICRERGANIILWAIDTGDWRAPSQKKIEKEVLSKVSGGEIVLMHDYVSFESHTPQALKSILKTLTEQGYEFVTVKELFGMPV